MSCLPGTPCYKSVIEGVYLKKYCEIKDLETKYVRYSSDSLPNTGITTNENLEVALKKIDATLVSQNYIYALLEIIQNNELLRDKLCEIVQECTTTTTTTQALTTTTTTII